LSTSAIKKAARSRHLLKTAIVYLAVSVFCVIFDRVYALFGHGVFSASMSFMFLYPLIAGSLLFIILWLFVPNADKIFYYRLSYNSYNSGVATLTVESALKGVFDIAGTSSQYLIVFKVCGWSLLCFGIVSYIFNYFAPPKNF
jgi:hypothetical protein